MLLIALTDGSVAGTGTLTAKSGVLGGILVTTNNSDVVTASVQRINSEGKTVVSLSTSASGLFISGPISLEGTQALYFSVSGVGGSIQLYEWVE